MQTLGVCYVVLCFDSILDLYYFVSLSVLKTSGPFSQYERRLSKGKIDVLDKLKIWSFHVVVLQRTAKKCTLM